MLLHPTLFRSGFLGLFLIDRGSICHIDPSSSESGEGAVRSGRHGGATVIAMITVVVVKMDWPAGPTLETARALEQRLDRGGVEQGNLAAGESQAVDEVGVEFVAVEAGEVVAHDEAL